jgi:hypothetical protein
MVFFWRIRRRTRRHCQSCLRDLAKSGSVAGAQADRTSAVDRKKSG